MVEPLEGEGIPTTPSSFTCKVDDDMTDSKSEVWVETFTAGLELKNPRRRKPLFELDGLTISITESFTPAKSITKSTAATSSAEKLTSNLTAATNYANKFSSMHWSAFR
jgi:hypothetical protein